MDETCVVHLLVSCPVVITRQDFFCLHVIFQGICLTLQKLHGKVTAVGRRLPEYCLYI